MVSLVVFLFYGISAAAETNVTSDSSGSNQGKWRSFVITNQNGDKLGVNISRNLKIGFEEENMTVSDKENGVDLSLPLENVSCWQMSQEKQSPMYPDIPSETKEIIELDQFPELSLIGRRLIINGIEQKNELSVYDMNGRLLRHYYPHISDPDSVSFELDLSGFPAGLYMLEVAGRSFKVLLK